MENNFVGTKGDIYTKEILNRILEEGCLDKNPRPHWADGTPAHTLSINHGMCSYDLTKGETPLITLRNIATKSSIGELLWIYQDASNSLDLLKEKYGVTWWDEWDIGNRTIGKCYGGSISAHDSMNELLNGMEKEPDGRRHILTMWLPDDFKEKHGLKPCAFMTIWNVRHGNDNIDYLDMALVQRSSDFITAGSINQTQYMIFLYLVANHFGYTPGKFTWFYDNIQIYDRHIPAAKELISRDAVECQPKVWINPDKSNFYDITKDDVKIIDYPRSEIEKKNKQLKLEIAI